MFVQVVDLHLVLILQILSHFFGLALETSLVLLHADNLLLFHGLFLLKDLGLALFPFEVSFEAVGELSFLFNILLALGVFVLNILYLSLHVPTLAEDLVLGLVVCLQVRENLVYADLEVLKIWVDQQFYHFDVALLAIADEPCVGDGHLLKLFSQELIFLPLHLLLFMLVSHKLVNRHNCRI